MGIRHRAVIWHVLCICGISLINFVRNEGNTQTFSDEFLPFLFYRRAQWVSQEFDETRNSRKTENLKKILLRCEISRGSGQISHDYFCDFHGSQ
jgi:hypothetical protein